MRRSARISLWTVLAIVALPFAVVALSEIFGWNWARPLVESAVGAATGRELEIEGDLDVEIDRRPRIVVERVRFANAEWSDERDMFRARALAFRFRPWPLLLGRIRLEELQLAGARLLLEVSPAGDANWTFVAGGGGETDLAALPDTLWVRDSSLRFFDARKENDLRVDFAALRSGIAESGEILLEGRGRYQKEPLALRGRFGSPARLRDNEPFPMRAELRAGATRARVEGSVRRPREFDGVDLDLRLSGDSLADLWPLVGLPLAETPPYRLESRLERRGATWRLRQLDGIVGRSDLHGLLAVTLRDGGRPLLTAELRSRALDLDDLEGFWGRPPREEQQTSQGEKRPVFPDRPFDFAKLRAMDVALDFRGERVRGGSMLDDVRVALELEGGLLELERLRFGFAGGALDGSATIDARRDVAELAGRIELNAIQLDQLLRDLDLEMAGAGTIGGRAEVRTRGNSLAEMAAELDGRAGAMMADGTLSEVLIELIAIDLGEVLVKRLAKDDDQVPIRCIAGTFGIEQGVMTADTLLLDTDIERITGSGTIDLGKERIDLRLEQHAKDFSVGSFAAPIEIEGTLAGRHVEVDRSELIKKGAAAAALGLLVHPAAALLPLVELGDDEQPGACRAALGELRRIASR